MARTLTDKVIIITGASSGIGAATAVECARAGMDVVLNARRADRLASVAEQVRQLGRREVRIVGDVTDAGISERMLDAAETEFGRFDAVFANAGYSRNLMVLDESDEEVRHLFEVNFFAALDLIRTAASRLIDQGRPGHLLMCSSCLSKFALPLHASYSATKACQNAYCSAMRHELRAHGIYVSSVHPITTRTEFFETAAKLSGHDDRTTGLPDHTPGFLVQRPERVARAVVKCLRRPRPEVWTSLFVRTAAGLMTMFPWMYELGVGFQTRKELEEVRRRKSNGVS
jgi:short-subunit dehydrogenase